MERYYYSILLLPLVIISDATGEGLDLDKGIDGIAKLVDAICCEGTENYSNLARVTGLPEETVRYKLSTQLPRRGLAPHIVLNYEKLGLKRKIVRLVFSNQPGFRVTRALTELAKHLYINYFGKALNSGVYTLMLAVPPNTWTQYKDFLKYLSEKGIVDSFSLEDILWSRHIPMRTDLYDFHKGEWEFEWSQADKLRNPPPEPPLMAPEDSVEEPNHGYEPDYVDLAILSELQVNATLALSRIASNIRVSEDIARYHYAEHVKKNGLISQYTVAWMGANSRYDHDSVSPVLFAVREGDKNDIRQVRLTFHKFPFSWLELLGESGTYYVFANISTSHFNPAMRFLSQNMPGLEDRLETRIFDPYESPGFALPLEMFDKKRGWDFNKALTIRDLEGLLSVGSLTPLISSHRLS
jgi:DNA-binding Lrp family transcriptional regulator